MYCICRFFTDFPTIIGSDTNPPDATVDSDKKVSTEQISSEGQSTGKKQLSFLVKESKRDLHFLYKSP